jgi:hypothetical protein
MGERRGGKREEGRLSRFWRGIMLVNNGGERRKGGKRVYSFCCWPTG